MKWIIVPVLCTGLVVSGRPAFAHGPEDLSEAASAAYESGEFSVAGTRFMELIENGWGESGDAFNAACSFALAGDVDAAFHALDVAIEMGHGRSDLLSSDPDLERLREDPRWKGIVDGCERNAESRQRFWDNPVWRTEYREDIGVAEKVAGLSRLWSGAKYGFVNFDLVPDLDWDRAYFESLNQVMAAKSTLEYYRVLQLMCVRLRDGHTYVTPPRELRSRLWSRPLVRTRLVEDRVLVVAVYGDVGERHGIAPGDEVLQIDGMPVREYAREHVRPYQFASTPQDLDTKTYETRLLAGADGDWVALWLARADGTEYGCELERRWGEARRRHVPVPEPMTLTWVGTNGDIAHVTLNTFSDLVTAESFETAFDELSRAKAMIVDLRENGGGNSSVGWRVLKLLTTEPFASSTWHTRAYRSAFREWGRTEGRYVRRASLIPPDGRRAFTRPVVVLTSPRTYSAAEDFCVSFRSIERGLVIGEPTGGSTGQPLRLPLPGGLSASICSKRDRYPDGTEFVGIGIQPDRFVTPSAADVRSARDPVLETAISQLERQLGD